MKIEDVDVVAQEEGARGRSGGDVEGRRRRGKGEEEEII
jgi:hypothetical protein